MKVGTDGVLLGSWVDVQGVEKILDVGAGTGLIALMMAQRSSALITGVEIENDAADEAAQNCSHSLWKNRIEIVNSSFQEFAAETKQKFDLVISNPPFFVNNQKSKCNRLAMAKHNDLLPFPELIAGCVKILGAEGRLALILPVVPAQFFIEQAENVGLFLNRLTAVRPNNSKPIHRYLMEFRKIKTALVKDCLNIHSDDNIDFMPAYKKLTGEFYLNF